MMERSIGELFEYDGKWYRVQPGDSCDGCCLCRGATCLPLGDCSAKHRIDRRSVIAVKCDPPESRYQPTDEVVDSTPPTTDAHKSPFHAILAEMAELHDAKNHDYSPEGMFGNFSASEAIGIPAWKGAFVRLQDKYTRACNLIGGKEAMV